VGLSERGDKDNNPWYNPWQYPAILLTETQSFSLNVSTCTFLLITLKLQMATAELENCSALPYT
jgi:hypothetical protein